MRKIRMAGMILCMLLCVRGLCPGLGLAQSGDGDKAVWKLATLAPKGIGWSAYIEANVYPQLVEATENNMQFKTYWGGTMGDDGDYLKKIRIGQLDGAGFSGRGCVMAVPEFAVLELPFLFESWDEVTHIRTMLRPEFDSYAQEHGFVTLQWVDQDFDQIYSSRHAPESLDALKKAKFGVWQGPVEKAFFESLGVSGIPIGSQEISTTIRTGGTDAIIAPAIWVVGAQLYTVFKYVNPIKVRYSPGLVLVRQSSFEAIPKLYQQNLLDLRSRLEEDFCKRVRADNARFVQAMVKYGVHKVEMSQATQDEIRLLSQKVYPMLEDDYYPSELLVRVQEHLKAYRAGKM